MDFRYCPRCGSDRLAPASEKSMRCGACGLEWFQNPAAAYVALITDGEGRLLVTRRGREPARGTLDLPGGFADRRETAEQGVAREVMEETGLTVTHTRYLFSLPNVYRYSGIDIPTLDLFFRCQVADTTALRAADDAAEAVWMRPEDIRPEDFGLSSIREGVRRLLTTLH